MSLMATPLHTRKAIISLVPVDLQPMPFMEFWPTFVHGAAGNLDFFGLLGLGFGFATGLMPTRRLILLNSATCSGDLSVERRSDRRATADVHAARAVPR